MHITIDVMDRKVRPENIDAIFAYFRRIDEKFSTYKEASEISQINNGRLQRHQYSADMKLILSLCELTRQQTNGYFEINHKGKLDPSGLVKGWSIWRAANLLRRRGFNNFYVDAGGDIQVAGSNPAGQPWTVGIRNPFDDQQIVKTLTLDGRGIATSGTACRGQHIYNPHRPDDTLDDIVSLSVIGPNVYEADRFATAAFAMGPNGIYFIEALPGFEAYMIKRDGIATYTSGFDRYVVSPVHSAKPESFPPGGHVTP
ncbi:MAG: FAD:protein FMN transferase [Candidatus Dormibacteraceae bacterium]